MDYYHAIFFIILGLILPSLVTFLLGRISSSANSKDELYLTSDSFLLNLNSPTEHWFNMGYWTTPTSTSTITFSQAAESLSRKLIKFSELKEGESVVDVGFGNGDSLLLLTNEFKLKSLIGITSLKSQFDFASHRISKLPSSIISNTEIKLYQGDASSLISTSIPSDSIDRVLALDCAYHFTNKELFLESSSSILKEDGTITLTDLILTSNSTSILDWILLRIVFYFASVPSNNILSVEDYELQLSKYFTDIKIEDLSSSVFPGFLQFLNERDKEMGGLLNESKWNDLMKYGKIVKWYSGGGNIKKQKLSFIIVTAKKRRKPDEVIY